MKKWTPIVLKLVPIVSAAVAAAMFLVHTFVPPPDKSFAYSQFGGLPVVFNGRVQPMDSLARNSLLQIREKQEANLEPWKGDTEKPKMISGTEWLTTLMMDPATADQWRVILIDNPDVISLLKLPLRPVLHRYYSWSEIQPALRAMDDETKRIALEKKESSQRTAYENGVMKLRDRLWLYVQLKNTVEPEDVDLKSEVAKLESVYPAGSEAMPAFGSVIDSYLKLRQEKAKGRAGDPDSALAATQEAASNFLGIVKTTQGGQAYTKDTLETVLEEVEHLSSVVNLEPPLAIPPRAAGLPHDAWKNIGQTLLDGLRAGKTDPSIHAYAAMSSAFQAGEVLEFNQQVATYRSALAPGFSGELKKARAEVFFNHMEPFYNAMVLYVLAALLVLTFWVFLSETIRRTAVSLITVAFVIHATGLIFRMVLEGRPPVTNLYSSAIFIGFGAVVLGLVLEMFHKNGIGAIVASGIAFITLIIAHFLARTGDTMEMMRAVLDTNLWLATHVVIVTLGYASTFVAGFLGLVYVILGVFTNRLKTVFSAKAAAATGAAVGYFAGGVAGAALGGLVAKRSAEMGDTFGKTLTRMIYGIVCFATLFSFVGTVLGGIWADQSWGRFWGWDPKENGALIIVLWNALILHLRWGGMIRERGLATAAIIGNIVTSWSWFGVNMLGIGLHSYGFMDAAFWWLIAFVLSQLAIFAMGCLPLHMWRSFRGTAIPAPADGAGTRADSPSPVAG